MYSGFNVGVAVLNLSFERLEKQYLKRSKTNTATQYAAACVSIPLDFSLKDIQESVSSLKSSHFCYLGTSEYAAKLMNMQSLEFFCRLLG